jgi:hypothetical protein
MENFKYRDMVFHHFFGLWSSTIFFSNFVQIYILETKISKTFCPHTIETPPPTPTE